MASNLNIKGGLGGGDQRGMGFKRFSIELLAYASFRDLHKGVR